jgi:NADPH2:quinone reductase
MRDMRAVRCHQLTGPAALQVDEVPAPPPPGRGEITIAVAAAGVNFPDVLITQGKYQFKPEPPFSPGGEVAGLVTELGPGVDRFRIGDRVAATMLHGAFAERVVVPETAAAMLPGNVSFETGAALLLTYATTLHALVDRAQLAAGETLLVLGAAGGVGLAAVELGKCMGARVIACASSAAKLALCKEHGADELIDYSHEDLKDRIKQVTGGGGADVVYDPVGGELAEAALRGTAWEGRYLVVGFASGTIPRFPANLVLLKGCQIVGVFWGSFALRQPMRHQAHVERLMTWLGEGRLRPHIDGVFPFEQASQALGLLERREVKGKVVLIPG